MKIAITSDLHLKTGAGDALKIQAQKKGQTSAKTQLQNPERFNALKNILERLLQKNVRHLIIAGDLFDAESQNYSIFDRLCMEEEYRGINFYIIPGNHDPAIDPKYFTAENIKVFNQPKIVTFGDSKVKFFFVPYMHGKSMGEVIASYSGKSGNKYNLNGGNQQDSKTSGPGLPNQGGTDTDFSDAGPADSSLPPGTDFSGTGLKGTWVLIGHGDYLSGIKEPNTYEKGIYMPLARSDIEYYAPAKVILGHIHKKMGIGKVLYPGSPCGMDINETGKRSFILLDLNDLGISEETVDTDVIFLSESLVVIPAEDESGYIRDRIAELVKKWGLGKEEISKARVRLKVSGYTSDKKELEKVIKQSLPAFTFYDGVGPDLSGVSVFNDPERISIVERVRNEIERLSGSGGKNSILQLKKDMVLEQALHIILKE